MSEEAVTYVLMIIVGVPAVAAAVLRGGTFGTGATLCAGMIALGAVGLVRRNANYSRHLIPRAFHRRDHAKIRVGDDGRGGNRLERE